MTDKTKNMIDAATNNDGAAFKAAFDAAINQKIGDALHTQRQDIATNIFGNIRVPTHEVKNDKQTLERAAKTAELELVRGTPKSIPNKIRRLNAQHQEDVNAEGN